MHSLCYYTISPQLFEMANPCALDGFATKGRVPCLRLMAETGAINPKDDIFCSSY
jgi:hypothetical protein